MRVSLKKNVSVLLGMLYALVLLLSPVVSQAQTVTPGKRILVFSKTAGFRHSSIPVGKLAMIKLGKENGYAVDTTEDAALFTEKNLKKYAAVVFLNTTGDVLNNDQQGDFERYIQAGGGYVGIHAATDTEYDWIWYNKLSGAYFASHPAVQDAAIKVIDRDHPSMKDFPEDWHIKDEFYDFKSFNKDVTVLLEVDEKTYKNGKMGDHHPMSWYHEYDGGKAFYTNFGHQNETFADPVFLKHLLGGLNWVAASKLDYSKSRPEENRFTKTVLAESLDEPTELVVLEDHKVIFTERKGDIKLYNPKTSKLKVIAKLPVYFKQEYGLMGLNIDPNFATNKLVYLFYSPPSTEADTAQRLSRFKFDDIKDTLLLDTEEILLTVPVKRTDCCHTGGSIAWDAKGNLYLSTGDDINPFKSNGYGPIDERPGREGFDGQHTSSNTNDLRGKIIRIKPRYGDRRANMPGGTNLYDIPEGNLFPPGTPKTRPEIYVMGTRNPYRISVDQHTGYVYWGDVGPDASNDDPKRGSRGYDEVNQARKAGYFGYPFFIGNNFPYIDYNFADSTSGKPFDPLAPINDSPHNTGIQKLPPAQPAFIWYPYAESPEFGSIVGKGGRNAMAGPVYYPNDYKAGKDKFPNYYNGKFFAYDWIRDYINVVTMNKQGDLVNIERFMPNTKFSHPIDMQFANDGSLYVIEYGNKWFAQNDDARLSHITFNAGNRPPVAVASAPKQIGAAPLKVSFSSAGSLDHDGDAIKYEWSFGKGLPKSALPNPSFTYTKAGEYTATLKVTDSKGASKTANLTIKVGNELPKVEVAIKGNKTFYWNEKPVEYEVKVADKEDGTLAEGAIADRDITVSINYLEGFDKTLLAQGHQANTGFATGKRLIDLSDCKACHTVDKRSVGPSYQEIAKRYEKESGALKYLTEKVIKGGGGVWGQHAMSAHPQLKQSEVEDMVKYVLSLANEKKEESKPLKDAYVTKNKEKAGSYIFAATYTDRGHGVIGPLTVTNSVALRPAKIKANTLDSGKGYAINKVESTEWVTGKSDGAYITFDDIDLTGIKTVKVAASAPSGKSAGGVLEARIGSITGAKVGEVKVAEGETGIVTMPITTAGMAKKLVFVYKNSDPKGKPLFSIDSLEFQD
jgi:cytochrome c